MSDALFTRQQSQLEGLRRQGRVNRVADITLDTVHLVNVYNVTDDQEDRFVVHLKGQARDWMEDQAGNMVSGSQELQGFTEYWTFARHPQFGWVVDEIQQEGEGGYHLTEEDVSEDEGPATYERSDA
jgi:predicted lipid-binding transport protein (Tim44 family)